MGKKQPVRKPAQGPKKPGTRKPKPAQSPKRNY